VQYVAGTGLDGVLRDSLPWRKVGELEAHHQARFALQQDWKHGGTGLPGVKARQADAESYWGSKHHALGVACADCHMEHAGSERSCSRAARKAPLRAVGASPDRAAMKIYCDA
jgi:formate-dependent nitrite reductase cytochrome c552 subunit